MPTVAYLGPEKTNTHFAARKKFGAQAAYLHAPTVEDVFQIVERRKADFGVVPVENSLEGAVTRTLDHFGVLWDSSVRIYGEMEQPIQHFLMTRPGIGLKQIKFVYSHPQALAQCQRWLDAKLPSVERFETHSTAEALEILDRSALSINAAIGRKELAAGREWKAIPIPIEQENRTRFLILSRKDPRPGDKNKTSLMVALKDKAGALHDALVPFKENKINLTKIESRPSKRKLWEYLFFIDCEGHESDTSMRKALAALRKSAAECRVLGSYPTGSGR